MRALILLEEEKYLPVANQLKKHSLADIEISNIDFNLTNSLKKAQCVILLGGKQPHLYLIKEYHDIVKDKLFLSTYYCESKLTFEIYIKITNGLVICQIPDMESELVQIISETCHNIFDESLKVLETNVDNYLQVISTIEQIENDLQVIIDDNLDVLPVSVIEHIFHQY